MFIACEDLIWATMGAFKRIGLVQFPLGLYFIAHNLPFRTTFVTKVGLFFNTHIPNYKFSQCHKM
jgi:hypothetical protein